MKRFYSLLAAALLLCGCSVTETITPEASVAGNTEESTMQDLSVLRDYLANAKTDIDTGVYDADSNGRLDARDLTLHKRRLLPEAPQENANVLVAYFSCTNNTAGIARYIIDDLKADSYVIEAAIPYTAEDLNYNADCRANREQNDASARPEIAGSIDISAYDTIFLGYPIWWGQAPKIIYTFMESADFTGKTIIPFCTSGSSTIGTSAENLSASAPDANWLDGRRFPGSAKESEVKAWVKSLEIPKKSEENIMYITVGDTKLSAVLADNPSAKALTELLKTAPLTVAMHDYDNFEKVGSLGTTLPRTDEQITTEPGDIILYQGSSITIYYDKNSWNFTRLGKISGVTQDELKSILGDGDVTVTFSLT